MTRYETCLNCVNHVGGTCMLDGMLVQSHALCGICPINNFTRGAAPGLPERMSIGKVLHGATGMAKVFFHLSATDEARIEERTHICNDCKALVDGNCTICKCDVWSKVRVASESCPWGKWSAAVAPPTTSDVHVGAGQGS